MAKIVLLNGSAHADGRTAEALNEMIRVFEEEGYESLPVQIGNQAIRGCADCGGCGESGKCIFQDDLLNDIAAEFETAVALIVGSPVTFNSPSGTLVSFLDRLFRSTSFSKKMKVGACVVTGDNCDLVGSIDTLNQYFALSGMKIASVPFWNHENGDAPDTEKDRLKQFRDLARRVTRMIRAISEVKETGEEPDVRDEYVTDFSDGDFDQLRKRPINMFVLDDEKPEFPDPRFASQTGFLAVGGDITVEWLAAAYRRGIFPWSEDGLPLMWFCPKKRFVLRPSEIHLSKNLRRFMRSHTVTLEMNRDFADTMHHCREVRESKGDESWINDDVEKTYLGLWQAGYGFSAEAYIDGELAGGQYGVRIGRCLIGESAFSVLPNGSKLCMYLLARKMEEDGDLLCDAQVYSECWAQMGFSFMPYDDYMDIMNRGLQGE